MFVMWSSICLFPHLRWYLGSEMTAEAAAIVLHASKETNCFGVYKSSEHNYILSAKYVISLYVHELVL